MDYIGIDLHKNSSQVCILTEDGELTERRIKTDRENLDRMFAGKPPAHIPVEGSTESEWAARHLEALGHEVIVADPNFAPMYATRDRRIKTDKRDARALCEGCRLGASRPAHRTAAAGREGGGDIAAAKGIVKTDFSGFRARAGERGKRLGPESAGEGIVPPAPASMHAPGDMLSAQRRARTER